ncbi:MULTISPECIES: hypothetical protein [Streptomyces]|uniref:Uncharacterized protein n=1 Tax=Streptomyces spororaveus TaxID=284039 RepID=A0ABQ3TKT7_9ACTN|nr:MULTISPECIES: hypothetical protein [Streptomyces]MCM9079077.1 hypothetical protein [Streptomyces spororaveus]MCX5306502.1 hypothetical protein [Streptomyces sp. NBC_00160]GHI80597.1 hypothetical protein Sspor_61580 [Streptomyces spororaveus]
MGMTVLYIAFGFVALWLLAEVLMQYKARLRWRLLAFAGFLGVVAGVILPSVPVIGAGALAFAVGQTLVTLSFRKGFVAGWALRRGGEPVRQTRRRRAAGSKQEPALQVTALQYEDAAAAEDGAAQERPFRDAPPDVYSPEPVPEDTGSYGIQSFAPPEVDRTAAFASPFTTAEQDAHQYAAYYDQQNQGGYDYSGGYPTGDQQQVYAAYSDPYIGTGGGMAPPPAYDYTPYAGYGQQQYSTDTPPGGVWVPQQRSTDGAGQSYPMEDQGEPPQQYPYPQQGGYEQYRY